jgi:hypothetical protein
MRASTAGLIVAFVALFWVNQNYQPAPTATPQDQTQQVVPPGFVPDPNYTWVPRTNVQTTTPETTTTTTATTTTPTPTPTTTTTESSPELTPTTTVPVLPGQLGPTTTVLDPDGPGPLPPQTFTPPPGIFAPPVLAPTTVPPA